MNEDNKLVIMKDHQAVMTSLQLTDWSYLKQDSIGRKFGSLRNDVFRRY